MGENEVKSMHTLCAYGQNFENHNISAAPVTKYFQVGGGKFNIKWIGPLYLSALNSYIVSLVGWTKGT